jgi:hypothetical protein
MNVKLRAWRLGSKKLGVSRFRVKDSGLGFQIPRQGFRVLDRVLRVQSLELRVWGLRL